VAQPPPGVVIRGRVPDLTAEYAAAAVVIVPLLQGSGVKIKLVEAASFGKAIVTTPIGLQGLDFLRAGVRETTTAPAFAAAVLDLLASETTRLELSRVTLTAAKQHLSPESCYRPTLESLSLHP
jgi:glycosyltransferase involved in cell wall biosynthesis